MKFPSSRMLAALVRGGPLVALLLVALASPALSALRIAGRVIDANTQKPIAGARVELANVSGGRGYFRARSGGDGAFALEDVSTERAYSLTVTAEGYAEFVLGHWQLPEAQRSAEFVVPLDRAGSIAVRVTRGDGRTAVAGARVQVRSERTASWWEGYKPPPAPVHGDARGVARFVDLAAGHWTVQVEASGMLATEARRVAVRRGEITELAVKLSRPASLSGVVALADGTPVAGLSVTARGPAEGVATTGEQGEFTVADLAPGKYRLDVEQEGFEPVRGREPLALAEGQSRAGFTVTVVPRAPELNFVLPREVFAPDEQIKLVMRSFRVGAVDLVLYAMPVAQVLDHSRDFRRFAQGTDTLGLARVRSWTRATADGPAYAWRDEELPIADQLEPGVYVLVGRAGPLERRALFFVSELGLVVKRSPGKLLISAASLKTGLAIRGAEVSWAPAPRPTHQIRSGNEWVAALGPGTPAGTTGEDGLLVVPLSDRSPGLRVIAVSERHGIAVVESPLAPAAERGGDQLYLYSERPIYRPGQTVYWKAFARTATAGGYAVPEATEVRVSLSGPEGASVEIPARRLSARGSADGEIALPRDLPLGEYVLGATAGRASGSAAFAIQEYRKPEFRVEVTPDRAVYANGDEVRFQIAASYFFGAPVFGATLRYNLFETRKPRDTGRLDDDGEFGFEGAAAGYGRVLETGEARTDLDGRSALTFTPERVAYDRTLTLEVEVVDASNRQVRGRGVATVGRGLFTVLVRPPSQLFMVGEPVAVEIRTRDHAGKAVMAAVTVDLDQDAWNPIERRTTRSSRPLASIVVTTDSAGRARVTLHPQPARSGQLVIRARAEDSRGNRITDETTVWIYDPKVWHYAYRYPSLEAFADRERYRPGDTARVVVNTDIGYAAVLATLEGREIEDAKVVHLFGNTGLVSFPIRAEHAPNVYLSLQVRKGKEVLTRTLDLAVAGERHDLSIALTADRAEYRPRDQARVRVETRDGSGRPVPAEVSVGVVDEAIYGLRSDDTPDPHEVFYGHRPNWVTTVVAFPSLVLGGASKGEGDEIRRDFRDLAHWAPTVITDAAGKAEVSFHFPDNLTTWRLTSRGVTADTRVGKAVARALVTKPLVARLTPPRLLVAGDQATLVTVVSNRSVVALEGVEEFLEARGAASVAGAKTARGNIAAGGESRREWRIEVPADLGKVPVDTLEAVFQFRARAKTDRDALEVRAPVRPRAVALHPHGAGRLEAARATVAVALPIDLVRVGSDLTLEMSPTTAALLLSAVEALDRYPWACAEQTANVVRPALAMLEALGPRKIVPPGWDDPAKRLAPRLTRLVALQNGEGGWGFWEGDDTDPFLTVLVLDALARAHAAGLGGEAVQQSIQRALYPALRALSEARTLDAEAYCLAHLTRLSRLSSISGPTEELKGRLEDLSHSTYSRRDQLSIAGLAFAARAHADLGRGAEAKTLLADLMRHGVSDGAGLHWPASLDEEAWFGDEEENTGLALSAMAAIAPEDSRAPDVSRWLSARRRGGFWRSTRASAPVALGLAAHLAAHPEDARPALGVTAEWNGERVLERALSAADAFGDRPISLRIPGSKLRAGENQLVLEKQGAGSVAYAWEARALVPSPGPAISGQSFRIERQYLRAERTTDRRGRPQILATPLGASEPIEAGDQILVRLTLRAEKKLRHLVIEDPRPTGFEVDGLTPEGVERPWNLHAEERDDRCAFFLSRLDAGETVIEYLVRPETAGRFTALPVSVTGMYDPDLEARGAQATMVVVARK